MEKYRFCHSNSTRNRSLAWSSWGICTKICFQEAAQLYQHAGMRQDAMKCLARLGDTKKMVEFAQLARDPNLFVLAANYLRSALTWQNDPSILKAIVTFYRKAKKLESLANFFAECSNHTVDTTGDYHRAIGLLGEALKQLSSSKQDTTEIEQMIRSRAMKIKEFIGNINLLLYTRPKSYVVSCVPSKK